MKNSNGFCLVYSVSLVAFWTGVIMGNIPLILLGIVPPALFVVLAYFWSDSGKKTIE